MERINMKKKSINKLLPLQPDWISFDFAPNGISLVSINRKSVNTTRKLYHSDWRRSAPWGPPEAPQTSRQLFEGYLCYLIIFIHVIYATEGFQGGGGLLIGAPLCRERRQSLG